MIQLSRPAQMTFQLHLPPPLLCLLVPSTLAHFLLLPIPLASSSSGLWTHHLLFLFLPSVFTLHPAALGSVISSGWGMHNFPVYVTLACHTDAFYSMCFSCPVFVKSSFDLCVCEWERVMGCVCVNMFVYVSLCVYTELSDGCLVSPH